MSAGKVVGMVVGFAARPRRRPAGVERVVGQQARDGAGKGLSVARTLNLLAILPAQLTQQNGPATTGIPWAAASITFTGTPLGKAYRYDEYLGAVVAGAQVGLVTGECPRWPARQSAPSGIRPPRPGWAVRAIARASAVPPARQTTAARLRWGCPVQGDKYQLAAALPGWVRCGALAYG